jgi:energy-coupling factor transporter ATP-binding protein EcfA2
VPRIAPVAAGNDVLTVDAVRFARGRRVILEDVSLRLREGEVLGITGANGAGKSTLLALCAGLLNQCRGRVLLDGKPVRSLSPRRRFARLGMLLQNPEHHFTALRVDHEAPRESLERFGLAHKAEGTPFALSEGEKRRLTLAAAFARGNTVFLMDEPTFSLDAPSRSALAVLIGELRRSGCSFLIVSHDHEFLSAVTDRQFRLERGALNNTDDSGETQ